MRLKKHYGETLCTSAQRPPAVISCKTVIYHNPGVDSDAAEKTEQAQASGQDGGAGNRRALILSQTHLNCN